MKLTPLHQKIWEAALSRQDLREDIGHAQTVTEFAIKLGELLHADLDIIIPAAILHDTGYFGMEREILHKLMSKQLSVEQTKQLKEQHMIAGAEFAQNILKRLSYDAQKTEVIVKIVRNHDYSDEPTSIEEKIVRDADKLWRYSPVGFALDIKRQNKTVAQWVEKLSMNFSKPNYFYTQESIMLAKHELDKQKPYYIIIRGPLGIGKTTISKLLSQKINATYISFDKILEENGLDKVDDSYTADDFVKANEIAINQVQNDLALNKPVIFDGCFYFQEQIDDLRKRLSKHKEFAFTLSAPVDVCIFRDANREKVYGVDAAQAVFELVNAVKYGVTINTANKSESDVVDEISTYILEKLNNP